MQPQPGLDLLVDGRFRVPLATARAGRPCGAYKCRCDMAEVLHNSIVLFTYVMTPALYTNRSRETKTGGAWGL